MPKTHSYGASYPSGAIVGHDGTVISTPDAGNEAPRIEDESRPGGAENAPPIDETPSDEPDEKNEDAGKPDSNVKPLKRTPRNASSR